MRPERPTWTPSPADKEQPRQVRRILKLFRPYRGRLAVVGLLVGAASLVSVATPFLLKEILDVAIPQGRTGLLSLLALGMILSAVVTSIFGVLQTLISTTVGQRVMHDLRTAVYGRLQHMSLAFFTRTRTGEVQSRIANDIGGMQATVTSTATSLVSNLTSVVATIVAMLALDWRLTAVSLLLLPIFVWISRRVGRERKKIATQRQKQMATMAATVTESLSVSGILLGRTMGRADSLTKSFGDESESLVDLEVRSNMAGRWRMAVITIVMAAMPAVIYWTAGIAFQLSGSTVSIGTLVAFVSLQQGLFRPTVSLLSTGVQIQTSLALFQRIFEYLDLPIDITEPDNPVHLDRVKGEIRFEDVEFRYDDRSGPILDGIDITVPAGGSLAVVGPTGAGKSTLSYLVPRLYDVTGGRVTLDGVDVRDPTSTRSRARSASSRRRRTSSTPRSPRTCASPSRTPPTRSWRRRRGRPRSTTTSRPCPTGTTRSSVSAATGSRAARSSGSPSPGPSCATRRCSSSTRRPALWTPVRSTPSRKPSTRCRPTGRRSPSRTACPPFVAPIRSWSSTPATRSNGARTRSCWGRTGAMPPSSTGTPNWSRQDKDMSGLCALAGYRARMQMNTPPRSTIRLTRRGRGALIAAGAVVAATAVAVPLLRTGARPRRRRPS